MHSDDRLGMATKIVHLGEEEKLHGAVVPPLFGNSTFVYEHIEELHDVMAKPFIQSPPHVYSRTTNPTVDLAAQKVAMMEGADEARALSSGMGAISLAVLSCVRQGSHVVTLDTVYGPVRAMLRDLLPRFGVTYTLVDGRNASDILDAVRPETTLIYLESPSSLFFRMQDIDVVTAYARERGIATVIDNTYCTPLHFNPLKHGIDLVCHSATKYLGGHSDLTAGIVCGEATRMRQLLKTEIDIFGSTLAPFSAWLLTRGMRTLKLRLQYAEMVANDVAEWLQARPEVEIVHHLGLESYAQRGLVEKYFSGTSGLFSFEPVVQDSNRVTAFVNALKLFGRGVSWGGYESLVIAFPMKPIGYASPRWVIRLSIGQEDPVDLLADLEQAMVHLAQ